MDKQLLQDWALHLTHADPATSDSISSDPIYYTRGICQAAIHVVDKALGIQSAATRRTVRLAFVSWLFDRASISSFKELTVAQARSLVEYKDLLGGYYADYRRF